MQAYKLKGKVDRNGKLIITESVNLTPGDVEVIVLQSDTVTKDIQHDSSKEQLVERPTKVKTFQDWFAKTQPAMSEFNADEAKWN